MKTPADYDKLLAWPGLAHAVMDAAVVVVAPEPTPAQCIKLLQMGVQDVLAKRHASDDSLGRVLRVAIERKRMDASAKRAFSTDLTTGLPTHAQLLEHMTHLLALREREPAAMALIVLRLEGFRAAETGARRRGRQRAAPQGRRAPARGPARERRRGLAGLRHVRRAAGLDRRRVRCRRRGAQAAGLAEAAVQRRRARTCR